MTSINELEAILNSKDKRPVHINPDGTVTVLGSHPEFEDLMLRLSEWRNADHEDNLVLNRHQVIILIEGVKANATT